MPKLGATDSAGNVAHSRAPKLWFLRYPLSKGANPPRVGLAPHIIGFGHRLMFYVLVRPATVDDIPALQTLIAKSARELQSGDYTSRQIESAIKRVYGVDSRLIADGTYLVAERASGDARTIIGCGGWSKRRTLYGGDRWRDRDDDLLHPSVDAAKIRAFFVHPDFARQGIGTTILAACEEAARMYGFRHFEMGATLTGAKFFVARGYVEIERTEVPLEDGVSIPVVRMTKDWHPHRTGRPTAERPSPLD